jgi:Type IV secretion system pilin
MIKYLLTSPFFAGISANFGKECTPSAHTGFLSFPNWYEYLNGMYDSHGACLPSVQGLSDVWLIVAAIIEILLRVSAIVAVIFIIYGGFTYTTSQGDPEATGRAKNTLVNAMIGLAIAVMAAAMVSFIAKSIT